VWKQEQRERRGKEITKQLLKEWRKDQKGAKDENKASAEAEKVTDVSQKRCLGIVRWSANSES
jgi:hypothetical protein